MNTIAPYLLAFFCLFFLLCFVWRSLALWLATGINPIVFTQGDDAQGYVVRAFKTSLVLILLDLAAATALGAQYVALLPWHGSEMLVAHTPGWLQIFALAMLTCALLICVTAQAQMGRSWRIGIDSEHTALIVRGLFRYSRNPIFLSMRLSLLGLVMLWLTPLSLAAAVIGELSMQIQVRLEESHLERLHGQTYLEYTNQTRRWI